MNKKIALITGVTGQDGALLAKFLIKKNYIVHGIKRRSSSFNTQRIDDIYKDPNFYKNNFHLHYGDLTDGLNIFNLINKIKPSEIYNLGAQSHVKVSFETPEYTANSDGIGVLRLLEAIKSCNLIKKTKFYQASTSELYGAVRESPQTEKTPFYPRSPYGVAKLYAHWITVNYRESYDMFNVCGLLFNHESERRGREFVTRKITDGVAKIHLGLEDHITLGNLDVKRDWGYAPDYVEAMWMLMQQDTPKDYVISTGIFHTLGDFLDSSFKEIGITDWSKYVKYDDRFRRPADVFYLRGDSTRAKEELGWTPKTSFEEMVSKMVRKWCICF